MEAVKQVSRNVAALEEAHRSFNRRDFDAMMPILAEDMTYIDHPAGQTMRGREEWLAWARSWPEAFSDARIDGPTYLDGGEAVVALFHGRGTNDGSFGPLPATGRRMDVPMCEVARFNSVGQVVSAEIFYDQLTILTQLGHIESPAT